MEKLFSFSIIAALGIGACIGGAATYLFLATMEPTFDFHPIADPSSEEYHVHADFLIYIGEEKIDLSDEQFMTSNQQTVHKHAHLHDGNGEVKHIHAEDITFAEFLDSLGITLTDSCLNLFTDNQYCSGEENEVLLYVNGELYPGLITQYVPVDNDRVLLYYGKSSDPQIEQYLANIPDDSCYYSGTCPERGIAPAESCGLTCEL